MEDANLFPPSTTTTPRLSYLAHKNTQEGHDIELMEETSPEVIPNDFTKKSRYNRHVYHIFLQIYLDSMSPRTNSIATTIAHPDIQPSRVNCNFHKYTKKLQISTVISSAKNEKAPLFKIMMYFEHT